MIKKHIFCAAIILSLVGHAAAFTLALSLSVPAEDSVEAVINVSIEEAEEKDELLAPTPMKMESQIMAKFGEVKPYQPVSKQALSSFMSKKNTVVNQELTQKQTQSFGTVQSEPKTYDAKLLGISALYPRYARQHGQSGRAVCSVEIDPAGAIVNSALTQSSGFSVLDNAALDALRGARFSSTDHNRPREALIAFTFKLED